MTSSVKENKIIADYLGWLYIPFNDLKGFPKAGWWEPVGRKPINKNLKLFKHTNGIFYRFITRNSNDISYIIDIEFLLKILEKFKKYKITPKKTVIQVNKRIFEGKGESIRYNTYMAIVKYINHEKSL